MKHKMWAVCYENLDSNPSWEPYTGSIYHFRRDAKARNLNVEGRVLPVMVEVIMPKRRSKANRASKP